LHVHDVGIATGKYKQTEVQRSDEPAECNIKKITI